MFQFPGFPSHRLCMIRRRYPMWIAPFGHLRINVCLQLPAAFRSLSRPSSAPSAKASALCSFLLNQLITRLFLFMLRCCLLFRQLHTLVCAFLFRSRALPKAENSSWCLPTLALKCRAFFYCLSLEALTQFASSQIAVGLMRDFPKSLIWPEISAQWKSYWSFSSTIDFRNCLLPFLFSEKLISLISLSLSSFDTLFSFQGAW